MSLHISFEFSLKRIPGRIKFTKTVSKTNSNESERTIQVTLLLPKRFRLSRECLSGWLHLGGFVGKSPKCKWAERNLVHISQTPNLSLILCHSLKINSFITRPHSFFTGTNPLGLMSSQLLNFPFSYKFFLKYY